MFCWPAEAVEEVGVGEAREGEEEELVPHQVLVKAGSHQQGEVEGGREEGLAGLRQVEEAEVEVTVCLLWLAREEEEAEVAQQEVNLREGEGGQQHQPEVTQQEVHLREGEGGQGSVELGCTD